MQVALKLQPCVTYIKYTCKVHGAMHIFSKLFKKLLTEHELFVIPRAGCSEIKSLNFDHVKSLGIINMLARSRSFVKIHLVGPKCTSPPQQPRSSVSQVLLDCRPVAILAIATGPTMQIFERVIYSSLKKCIVLISKYGNQFILA